MPIFSHSSSNKVQITFVFEFLLSFCLIFFFSSRSLAYRCSAVKTGTFVLTRFRALLKRGLALGEEESSVNDLLGEDSSEAEVQFSEDFC